MSDIIIKSLIAPLFMTQEQLSDIWQKNTLRDSLDVSQYEDPTDPMGTLAVTVLINEDTEQRMMIQVSERPEPYSSFEQHEEPPKAIVYCRIRGNKEEVWGDWSIC